MPQGTDNLEQLIESCSGILQGLKKVEGGHLSHELQKVEAMAGQLEALRDKFFIKTVAAVPATRKCLDKVEKVSIALDKYKDCPEDKPFDALKQALRDLTEAVDELVERAEMRGTTLT